MKAKILKSLLNIAPVILLAVALMQLYRANRELNYKYEALTWQMQNKTWQLDVIDATLLRKLVQQNVQKTNSTTWSGEENH